MTLLVRQQRLQPMVVRVQGRAVVRVLEVAGLLPLLPINDAST